jgi:hypothetical protein
VAGLPLFDQTAHGNGTFPEMHRRLRQHQPIFLRVSTEGGKSEGLSAKREKNLHLPLFSPRLFTLFTTCRVVRSRGRMVSTCRGLMLAPLVLPWDVFQKQTTMQGERHPSGGQTKEGKKKENKSKRLMNKEVWGLH